MASIGNLNAKITADASQFVSEFKRADNESRRAATAIDKEIDKLTKGVSKKFSLSNFGKDVLMGAGIGSGFALAQTAAELIASHWKEAAEAAKAVEDSTQKQLESVLALIKLHQTDQQQLDTALKDQARMYRDLQALKNPASELIPGGAGESFVPSIDQKAIAAKSAEIQQLGLTIDQLQGKIKASAESTAAKELAAAIVTIGEEGDMASRKLTAMADAQKYSNEQWEEGAKAAAELDRALEASRASAVEMEGDRTSRLAKANEDNQKFQNEKYDNEVKLASKANAEIDRIIGLSADRMTDSWVDALNGVEGAWSDLGTSIAREIEKIVVQLLIVKPLINGIGSLLGSFGGTGIIGTLAGAFSGYGKPAAAGGYRDGSQPYLVGENGPEIFNPGRAGSITPNNRLGGGVTYNIDARGTDVGVVARIEAALKAVNGSIEGRAVAAVKNNARRGG